MTRCFLGVTIYGCPVSMVHTFNYVSCASCSSLDEQILKFLVYHVHISCQPLTTHMVYLLLLTFHVFCIVMKLYPLAAIDRRIWIMWMCASSMVMMLLTALGWHDQCQLLYHKWWSWWNTQSYEAHRYTGDSQLGSVNICFLSCS